MVLESSSPAILSKDVLYIGSAVPLETSEGLEAVQQPLRSRYPLDSDQNVQGILSTLSILASGIQLHYKDDSSHVVLFPFSSLTMCAAVRCVRTARKDTNEMSTRFVSLSSPEAGGPNNKQPAIFSMIMRRTKGRQVLECHGFITMSPKDALDLVQCTASLDKRSKHGTLDTTATGINSSSYDISKGDTSFYEDSASLPDMSIQLVPGEPISPNAAQAFYKEPPPDGYFYSTKQELVKKYSLHKFTGAAGGDTTPSIIPPGADHFERRPGYAASHFSARSAMYSTQPRHPVMVPIRPHYPQPSYGRPMFVGPTPAPMFVGPPTPAPMVMYPRPHFFYPPPAMRVQPMPGFVPPPVLSVNGDSHVRPHLRRGGSSRSSSPSSIPDSPRFSSRSQVKTHMINIHDTSSESTSRPRTPPTDYDIPRAPRLSRREDFYQRHNLTRDLPMPARPIPGGGYYMLPSYGYYSLPPQMHPGRARSLPPYVERVNTKTKKNKKSKTKKKEKKKISKKGSHDESTDSVGYMSGPNADNKQPRDFRRLENQFQHERAFSQSLAEETRRTFRGGDPYNAYSLNNTTGNNENEFPPAMY